MEKLSECLQRCLCWQLLALAARFRASVMKLICILLWVVSLVIKPQRVEASAGHNFYTLLHIR